MFRNAAIVVILLTLASAGCVSFIPGSGGEVTERPALTDAPDGEAGTTAWGESEPTQNRETVREPTEGPPPGVEDGHLVDPAALYQAHIEVLDATSYRATAHLGQTVHGQRNTIDVSVRANATRALVDRSIPPRLNQTGYATSEGMFTLLRHYDQPRFAYYDHGAESGARVHQFSGEDHVLESVLAVGGFEVTETLTRGDYQFFRLRATEVVNATDRNYTAIDATALVRADGLVREFEANFTNRPEDESYNGSSTYEVTLTESHSITRPDWVSEFSDLEAEIVADGRLVRLSHRDGPRLADSASITLERDEVLAEGSLDSPLKSGGTLYLYATGDGPAGQLSVSRERPSVTDEFRRFGTESLTLSVRNGRQRAAILATANASD